MHYRTQATIMYQAAGMAASTDKRAGKKFREFLESFDGEG